MGQPNPKNHYHEEDHKTNIHLQPFVTLRLHLNNKHPTCLHFSSPLGNLLQVPFLINPQLNFFAIGGCVWCGLKNEIITSRERERLWACYKSSLGTRMIEARFTSRRDLQVFLKVLACLQQQASCSILYKDQKTQEKPFRFVQIAEQCHDGNQVFIVNLLKLGNVLKAFIRSSGNVYQRLFELQRHDDILTFLYCYQTKPFQG